MLKAEKRGAWFRLFSHNEEVARQANKSSLTHACRLFRLATMTRRSSYRAIAAAATRCRHRERCDWEKP